MHLLDFLYCFVKSCVVWLMFCVCTFSYQRRLGKKEKKMGGKKRMLLSTGCGYLKRLLPSLLHRFSPSLIQIKDKQNSSPQIQTHGGMMERNECKWILLSRCVSVCEGQRGASERSTHQPTPSVPHGQLEFTQFFPSV